MDTKNSDRRTQTRLLQCVLFAFFVSGAASQPLGSFIPFLRETYGFSYDLSGVLLSCQSVGNLIAVLAAGFLPAYLGRRRSSRRGDPPVRRTGWSRPVPFPRLTDAPCR